MRSPLKSKEQIIEELSHVFRAHGFEGASLTQLTKGTGLEKASLYHHFPGGKTEMAEAVLLNAVDKLKTDVIGQLQGDGAAQAKAEDSLSRMLEATEIFYNGGSDVCFMTIFSLDHVSDRISQVLKESIQLWLKNLENVLHELKIDHPKRAAQLGLATIQGALILSHCLEDPKVFKNALAELRTMWLP